jgi:hypothetical protein
MSPDVTEISAVDRLLQSSVSNLTSAKSITASRSVGVPSGQRALRVANHGQRGGCEALKEHKIPTGVQSEGGHEQGQRRGHEKVGFSERLLGGKLCRFAKR